MKNKSSVDDQSAAWTDSGRSSDEYYRVLTAWMTSGSHAGSAEKCFGLAQDYDRTLDVFIDTVRNSNSTAGGERHLGLALRYKSILSGDLDYFASLAMSLAAYRKNGGLV